MPAVANIVVMAAVAPSPALVVAGTAVMFTGLPIGVPLFEKVTVPLRPVALLLAEETVAVSVTGVAVSTPVLGAATTAIAVRALVTVRFKVAVDGL